MKTSPYEIDGVKTEEMTDFLSYMIRVRIYTHKHPEQPLKNPAVTGMVTVPKPIREQLDLKNGDLVEIAIRKPSRQVIKEYIIRGDKPL